MEIKITKPVPPKSGSLRGVPLAGTVLIVCPWCKVEYPKGTDHHPEHCICRQEFHKLSASKTPVTTVPFLQFVRKIPAEVRGGGVGLFGIHNLLKVYYLEFSPIPGIGNTSLHPTLRTESKTTPPVRKPFYGYWVHSYLKDLWEVTLDYHKKYGTGPVPEEAYPVDDKFLNCVSELLTNPGTHEILGNLCKVSPEGVAPYWRFLLKGQTL